MKENTLKQTDLFISNSLKKALFPCMLSILSANINVIVDGILVGQKLGGNALAAINLCLPVYLFMCVIGSFIASGTAINASKAIGKGNDSESNEYYNLSVILSFVASVAVTVLGYIFLNNIVSFLCSDVMISHYVYEYTYITFSGTIPKIMIYIPFWYLRLDGRNKEISYMMSILTFGNIILDVLFVYIWDFRVFGAGLASVIATAIAFAYGAATLMDENSSFHIDLKKKNNNISIKNIISAGLPSAFNNLCSTFRILIVNVMLMSIGGGILIAVFSAVNGVFSIAEAIILGIPQAGTAMLGVYCGERDNKSSILIVKRECIIGLIYTAIFSTITILSSPFINRIYGLEQSLVVPIVWMCLSVYPALICNILSSYYNISENNMLSLIIIFLRTIVMTYIGLFIVDHFAISTFIFLPFAEITTIIVLIVITQIIFLKNKDIHRLLLCNMKHEEDGSILNFSIENDPGKICEACELISGFCDNNGLSMKETMRVELAMEEAMTFIGEVNKKRDSIISSFDLRAFHISGVYGIRIRYDGIDFNPFLNKEEESLEYMGIRMVKDMLETINYQRTFGVNTLILLLKDRSNEQH